MDGIAECIRSFSGPSAERPRPRGRRHASIARGPTALGVRCPDLPIHLVAEARFIPAFGGRKVGKGDRLWGLVAKALMSWSGGKGNGTALGGAPPGPPIDVGGPPSTTRREAYPLLHPRRHAGKP